VAGGSGRLANDAEFAPVGVAIAFMGDYRGS